MIKEADAIIRELPTALLRWYDFRCGSRTLYVGKATDAMAEMLMRHKGLDVLVADMELLGDIRDEFSYVVCIAGPEVHKDPYAIIKVLRSLLTPDGVLLLGMNNRFGLRYFCGDRDPYTDRNFDCIENYRHAYHKAEDAFRGRMYDRAALEDMLGAAGLRGKFYSVLSDLDNPTFLYADDYIVREDFCNRVMPMYYYPETVFLEEEGLYRSLMDNGMFHAMANAYLIECTADGEFSDVLHVTSSLERGEGRGMMTVVHGGGTVTKQAAFPAGQKHIEATAANMDALRSSGIRVIDGRLQGNEYIMPYITADTGQVHLRELLSKSPADFLKAMDRFRDTILASSEPFEGCYEPTTMLGEPLITQNDEWPAHEARTLLLRRAYLDMVPLNSFYVDGEFVFYDQEFVEENFPAKFILKRMVSSLYSRNPLLEKLMPSRQLYDRYGVWEEIEYWNRLEWEFLCILRKERELAEYHKKGRRDADLVDANRRRLNFPATTYHRLFVDIFADADSRKLILFGSGRFAERFLELYCDDYPVYAIVDNNEERWGETLGGVQICSPELLRKMQHGEYKVLVCIKDYIAVTKQLESWDITEYGIFDPSREYQCRRHPIPRIGSSGEMPKKYHVGYIAGVFDLFHIGHLNLFRRAKEQCDYLIVGVVSDRGVTERKKVELFVPFEERAELVRACRYVDEVVEIPFIRCGTEDAWRMYHFDVQFSGSDYENNPSWLAKKAFLEAHGATMVFFPYTESTSSTKLKKLIEKKLL